MPNRAWLSLTMSWQLARSSATSAPAPNLSDEKPRRKTFILAGQEGNFDRYVEWQAKRPALTQLDPTISAARNAPVR